MNIQERRALRNVLLDRAPWLANTDIGPQSVSAGECDTCGDEVRLVQPCGPPPQTLGRAATPDWALGRACAIAVGVAGWCSGHEEEAQGCLDWLTGLPPDADVIARLWWLASGEVRPDPALVTRARALLE